MKTLILYFTTDGQTKLIAERLAQHITHETELLSLREHANMTDEQLAAFDQIVIFAKNFMATNACGSDCGCTILSSL